MSENREFSWGPEKRPGGALAPGLLGLCIVALLAAGVVGVALHHATKSTPSTTTSLTTAPRAATTTVPQATTATTAPAPPGAERLLDLSDHLSLAIPPGWQAPNPSSDALAKSLQAMKAANPSLATIIDNALAALSRVQLGLFAIDPTNKTTLYAYGAAVPAGTTADSIPTAAVAKQVEGVGGKNVHASQVHLPIGPAGQVTAELTIKGATIAQALDYFVIGGRLVTLTVVREANTAPLDVLHQIEPTLAIG